MGKVKRVVLTTAILVGSVNQTLAWKNIYNPACPTLNPNTDWKTYLTTKFGIPKKRDSIVGVHLNKARQVNDAEARGGLDPRMCYTSYFDHNSKTYGSYYTSPPGMKADGGRGITNLPGDPSKNEINVYGVLLFYNTAGEIIDKNGNVIGEMVCYGSNDCGGY
jgi:hypothetical protein